MGSGAPWDSGSHTRLSPLKSEVRFQILPDVEKSVVDCHSPVVQVS